MFIPVLICRHIEKIVGPQSQTDSCYNCFVMVSEDLLLTEDTLYMFLTII